MSAGLKCPFCKSGRVWKKGAVPTIHGRKTRYICFDCGKSFYAPKRESGQKKSG